MKKTKKTGKILLMAVLVAALGGAIWLNMNYSSSSGGFLTQNTSSKEKTLGQTDYVSANADNVTETSAKQADFFTTTRSDRESNRTEAIALLKETLGSASASASAKTKAEDQIAKIADRMEKEADIEAVLKAKGFEDAVVIIGDDDVNVVVKSGELLESQTLQIQDAVIAGTKIAVEKIKIVHIK